MNAHNEQQQSREAAMVVIQRDAEGKPTVWCDPEIADLVTALNAGGIPTVASCSGHGQQSGIISLRDGRELIIAGDYDSARRYERAIATQPAPAAAQEAGLTFASFRAANVSRCEKWHPAGICSWSPSDWLTAAMGELGELASEVKMHNRVRDGLIGNKEEMSPTERRRRMANEAADVVTYLDLFCAERGIDLGDALTRKFNEVSERVGFPERLPASPRHRSAGQRSAYAPAAHARREGPRGRRPDHRRAARGGKHPRSAGDRPA